MRSVADGRGGGASGPTRTHVRAPAPQGLGLELRRHPERAPQRDHPARRAGPGPRGRRGTARASSRPAGAASRFVTLHTPPSTYSRPPIVTGSNTHGIEHEATTASPTLGGRRARRAEHDPAAACARSTAQTRRRPSNRAPQPSTRAREAVRATAARSACARARPRARARRPGAERQRRRRRRAPSRPRRAAPGRAARRAPPRPRHRPRPRRRRAPEPPPAHPRPAAAASGRPPGVAATIDPAEVPTNASVRAGRPRPGLDARRARRSSTPRPATPPPASTRTSGAAKGSTTA